MSAGYGPVAARYSTKVDEPAGDILGNIYHGHIECLQQQDPEYQQDGIPIVDCFSPYSVPQDWRLAELGIHCSPVGNTGAMLYEVKPLDGAPGAPPTPSLAEWLVALGGSNGGWRQAFFHAATIVQGRAICENPLRRLFQPTRESYVMVQQGHGGLSADPIITLFEHRPHSEPVKVVEVRVDEPSVITLEIIN